MKMQCSTQRMEKTSFGSSQGSYGQTRSTVIVKYSMFASFVLSLSYSRRVKTTHAKTMGNVFLTLNRTLITVTVSQDLLESTVKVCGSKKK